MKESSSKALREALLRLKICTARDFRRAKRRVRKLARDLPAFDFVWVDALLQARRLTPFQARLLESGQIDRLSVGPYVLFDKLGDGEHSATYLVRRLEGHDRCILKVIEEPAERVRTSVDALSDLQERLGEFAHPSVVGPQSMLEQEGKLLVVSRYIPGPHLGELLVRRGRFPADVVREIAKQLVDGLAGLESRHGVHGDITLANVRLTRGGVAALVDAGIKGAVQPGLIIQAHQAPALYDGIAPELIGTGNPVTIASDMYALGCILWHLLVGRPPFITGDSLGKLAAHQTRLIPDVREWAPDTPPELADLIRQLTRPEPAQRPGSFQAAREQLGYPRPSGRRRLARFQSMFDVEARGTSSKPSMLWPTLVVMTFLFSGAALSLVDLGANNALLRLPSRFSEGIEKASSWVKSFPSSGAGTLNNDGTGTGEQGNAVGITNRQDALLRLAQLPAPDQNGVVRLEPGRAYEAESITSVGSLTLSGDANSPPEIIVTERPFQIAARDITLQDVQIRLMAERKRLGGEKEESAEQQMAPPGALVLARSQTLNIIGCRFVVRDVGQKPVAGSSTGSSLGEEKSSRRTIALGWKVLDPLDRAAGRIMLMHSLFAGDGSILHLASVPRSFDCDNCLQIGGGPFLSLAEAIPGGRELPMRLHRLTLRESEALLRLRLPESHSKVGRLSVAAENCVMNLGGEQAALVQIVSKLSPDDYSRLATLSCQNSLADDEVRVSTWLKPGNVEGASPEGSSIELEGISVRRLLFQGPLSLVPSDALLHTGLSGPLESTSGPPGIDPGEMAGKMRTRDSFAGETNPNPRTAEGPDQPPEQHRAGLLQAKERVASPDESAWESDLPKQGEIGNPPEQEVQDGPLLLEPQ